MSRRKHSKLKKRQEEKRELKTWRQRSAASRIMDWVINGSADGALAVHELFPLPAGAESQLSTIK